MSSFRGDVSPHPEHAKAARALTVLVTNGLSSQPFPGLKLLHQPSLPVPKSSV